MGERKLGYFVLAKLKSIGNYLRFDIQKCSGNHAVLWIKLGPPADKACVPALWVFFPQPLNQYVFFYVKTNCLAQ